MAFIIIDGFDTYNGVSNTIGIQSKWTSSGSNSAFTMQPGRFDGQSLRCNDGTGNNAAVKRPLPASISQFCVGWAMRVTNLTVSGVPANQPTLALFDSANAYQISVAVNADGAVKLYRGDAAALMAASAAGVMANDTWHYFELIGTIADSGGTLQLYCDGTLVVNFTGDTKQTANANVAFVELAGADGTGAVTSTYYDDFYMTDTAVRVGERRVKTLYPSADVSGETDWIPTTGSDHYSMVNEPQVDTSTYIAGSNVGDQDLFDLDALGTTPTAIDAINVSVYAQKTDAAARAIGLQVKSGSTLSDGTGQNLATAYARYERLLETNPDGGGAWDAAAINALQAGVKVTT